MKKKVEENKKELPLNYGEIMAKIHMIEFKEKVLNSLKEPELNPEFIEEVKKTEKQEEVLVENIKKYRK